MGNVQPIGNTFGQYEIREQVGRGGMGVVYRATQPKLGREVAVKILSIFFATPRDMKRFEYEARTAATLEHPNIVPIYDYGTQDETSFVVMRLLTGGSLSTRISGEEGRMPLQDIAQITLQLASALDYAHSKGIIHRDVKPANILFDDHDVPYLVDFGIVKLLHSGDAMTSTDEVMGSLPFIAPEQLRRAEITPAADQYSLAVTVYMMLTGHLPHEAESPYVLMNKRLSDPPKPVRDYRPDLPKSIGKVMQRALDKEPAKRYANVSAFALELYEAVAKHQKSNKLQMNAANLASQTLSKSYATKSAAVQSAAIQAPPTTTTTRKALKRQVRWLVAVVVVLVLLIVVGGVLFYQQSQAQNAIFAPQTATAETCRVRLRSRANVRSGPGTGFDEIRAYDAGFTTVVVGRATDASGNGWWYVEVPSLTTNYWVADAVTEEFGNCSAVPVVEG